jgi:hypothetical protein
MYVIRIICMAWVFFCGRRNVRFVDCFVQQEFIFKNGKKCLIVAEVLNLVAAVISLLYELFSDIEKQEKVSCHAKEEIR